MPSSKAAAPAQVAADAAASAVSLFPKLPPHRPSEAVKAAFEIDVKAFCARLLEVRSGYDKPVGSRGWAYILEGDGVINKNEIDAAQKLINDCRKSGDLPIDFCAEDEKRAAANVEVIDPGLQSITSSRRRNITRPSASGTISTCIYRWLSRSRT
jgi:hypothetical protein